MRLTLIALGAALALAPGLASAQTVVAPTAAPAAAGAVINPASLPGAAAAAGFKSETTTMGEVIDNPAATALVKKRLPGVLENDQIEMARGMSIRSLQQYSPDIFTDKALAELDADFAALATKK